MAKAMLIIDMPSSCGDCPLCDSDFYCGFHNVSVDSAKEDCPLRDVPEKKETKTLSEFLEEKRDVKVLENFVAEEFMKYGYNACIDEILGGGE